jgi:cell wall-associated NlpC family hydrolase
LQTISVVLTAAGLALAAGTPAALAKSPANSGGAAYAPAAASVPSVAVPVAPLPPLAPSATQGTVPPGTVPVQTGGQAYGQLVPVAPPVIIPGAVAKILPTGFAAAPADAPPAVQQAIFAANQIVGRPYVYGGGHQSFTSAGYDCSGTVSFALHGASLITTPMDSSEFMRWGVRGPGQWITIFSNAGHVYMNIAGIRLDTSAAGDPSRLPGPRWRPLLRSSARYKVRSLPGL